MIKEKDSIEYEDQADLLYDQKKYNKTALKYIKSIRNFPNDYRIYNNIGYSFYKCGKNENALKKFKTSLILNPKFTRPHFNQITVLKDLQKYEEAISICERLLQAELCEKNIIYHEWGLILESQEKYEQACQMYSEAIKFKPNDAVIYTDWGIALRQQGKTEEAIEIYMKIIDIDPNDSHAYNNLGVALYHQQKYDKALEYYQKSVQLDAKYLDSYVNMGLVLLQQGKEKESIEMFQEGIKIIKENILEVQDAYKTLKQEIAHLERNLDNMILEQEIDHVKITIKGMKQIVGMLEADFMIKCIQRMSSLNY